MGKINIAVNEEYFPQRVQVWYIIIPRHKCMYTQAQAFQDWSFWDFMTIEKFLCVQIFPIDSRVKWPNILSFLYWKRCHYQDLKQWKSVFLPINIEIPLTIFKLYPLS